MMILCYPSKKAIAENIGKPLKYIETSFFGAEYNPNGKNLGCNRPTLFEFGDVNSRCYDGLKKDGSRKKAKEFFAVVHCENGLIVKVE